MFRKERLLREQNRTLKIAHELIKNYREGLKGFPGVLFYKVYFCNTKLPGSEE